MEKIKAGLIILAVGAILIAGFLSLNLMSPQTTEYDLQSPSKAYEPQSSKSTAQVVIEIMPNGGTK
ncbi:MAG: hypothetical protein NTW67_02855 [Candidatus Woesearchaeota archaeon]|nr:hypothetical protein [Candidatus Woesearchaeota archaeon]